jgi:hypothetical protein
MPKVHLYDTFLGGLRQDSTLNGKDLSNIQGNTNKTYSTMLKLISGALAGGTNYSEIYITYGIEEDDTSTASNNRSNDTSKHSSNDQHRKFQHCRKSQEKLQGSRKWNLMKNNT